MSIPYFCATCGDIIGARMPLSLDMSLEFSSRPCPGKGKHNVTERTERKSLFGLLKKIYLWYPETHTASEWYEYSGPRSKFWLWFALVFGTWRKGVLGWGREGCIVNGKWAWYDRKYGVFGEGAKELLAKQV